jgi:phospholipid/cholesterol/gamma-HCH transport system permease protein
MATPAEQPRPIRTFDLSLPRELVPGARATQAMLSTVGEITLFSLRVLAQVRGVWRYASEILVQTRTLLVGTTAVMLFLMSMLAGTTALFGSYVLRSIGASDYVGLFTALSGTRATVTIMFGYVFAAKVGCGFVAEIGSMRISDEIEAYDSIGLNPMRFVAATRLMAVWIFTPIMFCLSSLTVSVMQGFFVVHIIGEVSQGNWASVHWALSSVLDQAYSFIEVFIIATGITFASLYYAFTVRGGPADVGSATGKSMVFNLVFTHVVFGLCSLVFYGANPLLPIGASA